MKPGVSSYAFGWAVNAGRFTPDRLLDFALEHQLPVVQFGDHVPLHLLQAAELDRLAARAREAGVEIQTGARRLTAEHLETCLTIARRLGARLLRFVIDEGDYQPPPDGIASLLRNALPSLASAGVTLAIENHDRFPCATLRRLVDDLDSPQVGICLDTANSLGAGEGIAEVLAQLAPVCVNLHLKDFAIARLPYLMGFTVTGRPLGEGMLPLAQVLATVARHDRCRTAVVETWPPPEAEISATLAKELDWAIRSVQVLRAALCPAQTRTPTKT
jgi:sugar phosphate isomerase/epimerase